MTEPLPAATIEELERIDAEANAARQAYVRNPSDDAKRIRLEQANIALDLWLEVNRMKLLAAARRVAELPDVGEPDDDTTGGDWRWSSEWLKGELAVSVTKRDDDIGPALVWFGGDFRDLTPEQARWLAAALLAAARSSESEGGGR